MPCRVLLYLVASLLLLVLYTARCGGENMPEGAALSQAVIPAVQPTLCSVQCDVCRFCSVCSVLCAECSVTCAVIVQCAEWSVTCAVIVQCAVCCVLRSVWSVHLLFSVQCAVCRVQSALFIVKCTEYNVHLSVCSEKVHWVVCSEQSTVCRI